MTTPAAWPAGAPFTPLRDPFAVTGPDQFVRFDTDSGIGLQRRRRQRTPRAINLQFSWTAAELAAFESWRDNQLLAAGGAFTVTSPEYGARTFRVIPGQPDSWVYRDGTVERLVTFPVEMMP
jgi:hypothetical protein